MKNNLLYLSNIQECIEAIESDTPDAKKKFMQTRMIQDAVIRNLRCYPASRKACPRMGGNAHQEEVIGEATKKLSPEFRAKYPEVPWRRIAGLRDVLIHDYLRVDLDEVWGIIINDLPHLKTTINKMIQDFRN